MEGVQLEKFLAAINSLLRPKKIQSELIRIQHGAQFSKDGITFGWLLIVLLIIIAIFLIINGVVLISIPLILICIPIVAYFMDYQGIEIDSKKGKIRNYCSFLGKRTGKWHDLKDFNRLKIYQDSIIEGKMMATGSTYSSSRSDFDTHHFYALYIINDDGDQFVKLYEDESITRVRRFASRIVEMSDLVFIESINKRPPEIIGRGRTF